MYTAFPNPDPSDPKKCLVKNDDTIEDLRQYYFYGAMIAFLTLGIFTDLLARGKNVYTLLACLIAFQILSSLTGLIYYSVNGTKITGISAIVCSYGYIVCLGVVMQL